MGRDLRDEGFGGGDGELDVLPTPKTMDRGRLIGGVGAAGLLEGSKKERVFWKNEGLAVEGELMGVLARLEGEGNVGRRGLRNSGGGVCSVGKRVRDGDEE